MAQQAGGTSVPDGSSPVRGIVIFAIVAPIVAVLVNRMAASTECGWDYGAVGGACRAIILIAVIAGVGAGLCAAGVAKALAGENQRRAGILLAIAIVGVILAVAAAKQFQDYRSHSRYAAPE